MDQRQKYNLAINFRTIEARDKFRYYLRLLSIEKRKSISKIARGLLIQEIKNYIKEKQNAGQTKPQ